MLNYVICPICKQEKATGGSMTFRCCKHEFLVEAHKTDWNDSIARKTEQKSPKKREKQGKKTPEEIEIVVGDGENGIK